MEVLPWFLLGWVTALSLTALAAIVYAAMLHGRLDALTARVAAVEARVKHAFELIDFVGDAIRDIEAREGGE